MGGSLGAGLLVLSLGLGAAWLATGPAAIGALASLGLGAAIGRGFDLKAQLEAVAGARRGQLALFDQVDDQLAAKLDALARAGAKLEADSASSRAAGSGPGARGAGSDPSQRERDVLAAAEAIHSAAGDLECWFEGETGEARETAEPGEAGPRVGAQRAQLRAIREWAVSIVDEIAPQAQTRRVVDLTALVARAVACVRPTLVAGARIQVEAEPDLEPVACEPIQIEQVVIQLLRNAIEASQTISATPEARITLRQLRAGIEVAVEDRGTGIDSCEVDEVFDPFFGEQPLGVVSGFGLPNCLRIVEAHGGELRIEAEDRPGTRVSILLPRHGQAEEA
jgi:anti-sigma regulatory factor (Ser/Thr protein kinase)